MTKSVRLVGPCLAAGCRVSFVMLLCGYIETWLNCNMNNDAEIDALFLALSDRTRRAILLRLAEGESSVNDLCEPFDLKRPTVSKHLKILEQAGLITTTREAQFRTKALNPRTLRTAGEWIGHCTALWEEKFDRLADYINELERKDPSDGK